MIIAPLFLAFSVADAVWHFAGVFWFYPVIFFLGIAQSAGSGAFGSDFQENNIAFVDYLPIPRYKLWLANMIEGLLTVAFLLTLLGWYRTFRFVEPRAEGAEIEEVTRAFGFFTSRLTLVVGAGSAAIWAFCAWGFWRVYFPKSSALAIPGLITSLSAGLVYAAVRHVFMLSPSLESAAPIFLGSAACFMVGSYVGFVILPQHWTLWPRFLAAGLPIFLATVVISLILVVMLCLHWARLSGDPKTQFVVQSATGQGRSSLVFSAIDPQSGFHTLTLTPADGSVRYLGRGMTATSETRGSPQADLMILETSLIHQDMMRGPSQVVRFSADGSKRVPLVGFRPYDEATGDQRTMLAFSPDDSRRYIREASNQTLWLRIESDDGSLVKRIEIARRLAVILQGSGSRIAYIPQESDASPPDESEKEGAPSTQATAEPGPGEHDEPADADPMGEVNSYAQKHGIPFAALRVTILDTTTGATREFVPPSPLLAFSHDLRKALCLRVENDEAGVRTFGRIVDVDTGEGPEFLVGRFPLPDKNNAFAKNFLKTAYSFFVATKAGGVGMVGADPNGSMMYFDADLENLFLCSQQLNGKNPTASLTRITPGSGETRPIPLPKTSGAKAKQTRFGSAIAVTRIGDDGRRLACTLANEAFLIDTNNGQAVSLGALTNEDGSLYRTVIPSPDCRVAVCPQMTRKKAAGPRQPRARDEYAYETVLFGAGEPRTIYTGAEMQNIEWINNHEYMTYGVTEVTATDWTSGKSRVLLNPSIAAAAARNATSGAR